MTVYASQTQLQTYIGASRTLPTGEVVGTPLTGVTGVATGDLMTKLGGHGLLDNALVRFTALSGGAGLVTATDYYMRDVAADPTGVTFRVAATPGAAAINFTSTLTDATMTPILTEVSRLLARASDIIDYATRSRAQNAYDGNLSWVWYTDPPFGLTQADYVAALSKATCAQVEFWLEFGEEHDIIGLAGSAEAGRVILSRLPARLATRAADILHDVGLLSAKAGLR